MYITSENVESEYVCSSSRVVCILSYFISQHLENPVPSKQWLVNHRDSDEEPHYIKGKHPKHFPNMMFTLFLSVSNHSEIKKNHLWKLSFNKCHITKAMLKKKTKNKKTKPIKGQVGTHAFISFSSHFAIKGFAGKIRLPHGHIGVRRRLTTDEGTPGRQQGMIHSAFRPSFGWFWLY